jgi:hypothetical protein
MMMNCDTATELLPWLLNGTLDAGERLQALEHVRSCGICRAALADTRMAWEIFDWHPPVAALVAYAQGGEGIAVFEGGQDGSGGSGAAAGSDPAPGARGELGGLGASGIRAHLASCPRCAAELELVRTSRLLVDPAEDGRIAILAARHEQRPVSSGAAAPISPAASTRPSSLPLGRDEASARRAWRRSALAASLVGLLAATGWLESARQTHDLERRLAAVPHAAAPRSSAAASSAPGVPAVTSQGEAADLKRRAGEAEARLAALARQNQQLQQQVADLGRTAAALSQRSDALRAPHPQAAPAAPRIESDVVVSDLAPAGQTERGTEAPAAPAIPLSAGAATLLLHTRHRGSYPSYELEVRDAQGRLVGAPIRVVRVPGSQETFEEFDITLGRGALAPGAYVLHLYGRPAGASDSARDPLETYSIRVS